MTLAVSSCSKEESPMGNDPASNEQFRFDISLEDPAEDPTTVDRASTRAEAVVARYILEMYDGNIETQPIVRKEQPNGTFKVTMEKNKNYICLFWADNGSADYAAASLKAVSQTSASNAGKVAYFGSKTVNSNNFDGNVKLIHAVAEINFVETVGFTSIDNTLEVTYPFASTQFNVYDGTVSRIAGTSTHRFEAIGAVGANSRVATDYLLAPVVKENITPLKFKFNAFDETQIAALPVQANFRTEISGKYMQD